MFEIIIIQPTVRLSHTKRVISIALGHLISPNILVTEKYVAIYANILHSTFIPDKTTFFHADGQ